VVVGQSDHIIRSARVCVLVMGMGYAVSDSRGEWLDGSIPIVVGLVLG